MSTPSLRDRAAGNDVQRPDDKPTLGQLIERMRPEIARALPKHIDADRVCRIALTVLRQTPALAQCTPESFMGALMTASQLGLEPGALGEAYLVPYGRVCTFIPGYRGLIKLAWQSDQIESLRAETVHENDHFLREYGSNPRLEHTPPPLGQDRGKAIGWYALAKLKTGGEAFIVMDRAEVDRIKDRSKASKNGPWVTDYDAMAKKTCIKQLSKWIPLSAEIRTAITQDGAVRTDLSTVALEDEAPSYIDGEIVDEDTGLISGGEELPVEDPPAGAE